MSSTALKASLGLAVAAAGAAVAAYLALTRTKKVVTTPALAIDAPLAKVLNELKDPDAYHSLTGGFSPTVLETGDKSCVYELTLSLGAPIVILKTSQLVRMDWTDEVNGLSTVTLTFQSLDAACFLTYQLAASESTPDTTLVTGLFEAEGPIASVVLLSVMALVQFGWRLQLLKGRLEAKAKDA